MPLRITLKEREPGVFVISPTGSVDSNTYSILEKEIDTIIEGSPTVIVFDMGNVNYISSMGVRVILKTREALKKDEGEVVLIKLKPHIKKVFEIIQALPSEQIFNSLQELDDYLDRIQRKFTES